MSLEEQHVAIQEASKIAAHGIGLLLMDSATALYRAVLEAEDNRPLKRTLTSQLSLVQEIARRYRIPIVVTNQVYMDVVSGELRPIGGTSMEHICKAIVSLERLGGGRRRARIVKHRSQPEGESVEFTITATGVV
ncbi:DNA repair and recombination protein RadB [uncultured archaeon]|nr:DNA repair and recombination protein RadB [uncultured archaeon]